MRNTACCKNLAVILLVIMTIQCFPQVAMGYDISAKIKAFTSSQVKESDKIIDSNYTKVKKSVGQGIGKIEHKVLDGFSLFENKTGLNQQNWFYGRTKNKVLKGVGLGLGLTKGVTDISLETYSLLAKAPTLPERTINFAYNYSEDSQKYRNKVTSSAKAVTDTVIDVAKNPLPVLSGVYQYGKSTYTEAKKSPLAYGKLEGEVTAVLGSFLVGGTQIKALTSANKVEKVAKVGTVSKQTGPLLSLKGGWRNFAAGEKALFSPVDLFNNGAAKITATGMTIKSFFAGKIKKSTIAEKNIPGKFTINDLEKSIKDGAPLPVNNEVLSLVANLAKLDITKASKITVINGKSQEPFGDFITATTDMLTGEVFFYRNAFDSGLDLARHSKHELTHVEQSIKYREYLQEIMPKLKNEATYNKKDHQSLKGLFSKFEDEARASELEAAKNFAQHFPDYELKVIDSLLEKYALVKKR